MVPDEKAPEPTPEETAWAQWEDAQRAGYAADPDRFRRNYNRIRHNIHKSFYQYNDTALIPGIEPRFTHAMRVVNPNFLVETRRGRARKEVHQVYRDATQESVEERLNKLSRKRDPLHDVVGDTGSLGSRIQIKVMPSVIYICIKKAVQEEALKLLADRIMEHTKTAPTRILLKRSSKGKYSYTEWISTKAMGTLTIQDLVARLLKATRNRTKYITLALKQQRVGGAIHDRIRKSRTLI